MTVLARKSSLNLKNKKRMVRGVKCIVEALFGLKPLCVNT